MLSKNVKCFNLPPELSWVSSYKLKYSFTNHQKNWKNLFSDQNSPPSYLYSQSQNPPPRILILPCILEALNLHTLISSLNAEGINCAVLLPTSLFFSSKEISPVLQSSFQNTLVFAVGLSYNICQSFSNPVLVYNSVQSPKSYYQSFPTFRDKETIVKSRKNFFFLQNKNLDIYQAFPISISEWIPEEMPEIMPRENTVFYETSKPWHEFPSVYEKSSFLLTKREVLISKILKSMIK